MEKKVMNKPDLIHSKGKIVRHKEENMTKVRKNLKRRW